MWNIDNDAATLAFPCRHGAEANQITGDNHTLVHTAVP